MQAVRMLVPVVLALTLSACASGTGGSSNTRSGPRNQLSQEQMLETGTSNVYDAVRRLRPEWLRVRGTTGGAIIAYMDGVRQGTVDALERIPVQRAITVRFVSATDATMRWGTGHTAGAIEVLTR